MINEVDLQEVGIEKKKTPQIISSIVLGNPIAIEEIKKRLAYNEYIQLSENDDQTVLDAIDRAIIYVSSIIKRFNLSFTLDDIYIREVVLILSIYELHIALGHEEAGRDYYNKAKSLIKACWGDYPDSNNSIQEKAVVASVVKPKKDSKRRF